MRNLKSIFALAAFMLFIGTTSFAQCSSHSSHSSHKSNTSYNAGYDHHSSDIVDIAAGSEDFSTLVAAVKAADLVGALKADGPITVFAPTNTAFSKVPSETLNSLLKPENKDQLTSILTYHVVAGNFDAEAVVNAIQIGGGKADIKTLNGSTLTAMIMNDNVVLKDGNGNYSAITKTDLRASNGYIHVIDTVVLP